MNPRKTAAAILTEFASDPDLYPNLDMDGNVSGNVATMSISTGVTITVTIFAASVATARVMVERGDNPVSSAIFTEFSQEWLVDTTVGYIARTLHQFNHQAAA